MLRPEEIPPTSFFVYCVHNYQELSVVTFFPSCFLVEKESQNKTKTWMMTFTQRNYARKLLERTVFRKEANSIEKRRNIFFAGILFKTSEVDEDKRQFNSVFVFKSLLKLTSKTSSRFEELGSNPFGLNWTSFPFTTTNCETTIFSLFGLEVSKIQSHPQNFRKTFLDMAFQMVSLYLIGFLFLDPLHHCYERVSRCPHPGVAQSMAKTMLKASTNWQK